MDLRKVIGKRNSARIIIFLACLFFMAQTGYGRPQKENIGGLVQKLKHRSLAVQLAASEKLEKIGEPAVPYLIKALKDKNATMRKNAAEILGTIKDVRAIAPLIALGNDQKLEVRMQAINSLVEIGPAAAEPLAGALNDKNENIRLTAGQALKRIGEPAVQPLIALLKDKDSRLRQSSAYFLGEARERRAVSPLIVLLKDSNRSIQTAWIEALGKIG